MTPPTAADLQRSLAWAQEMQGTLHAAGYPTRLSADENGVELLVPLRGILYHATSRALAEICARHDGSTVVDFAQGGIRFLAPRPTDTEATTDA